jgi:hypothetical protein
MPATLGIDELAAAAVPAAPPVPVHPWVEAGPARAPAPPPRTLLGIVDQMLRDRTAVVARIQAGDDVVPIMKAMVATIAVAMAIVGAALGRYHGGAQILYAGIKLPLVILGTAALSAPALSAIGTALGRPAKLAADLALVIAALAFGALVLAAFTPLVLLAQSIDVGYHKMILLVVAMFSSAGIASLAIIARGLQRETGAGRTAAVLALIAVFGLVGGQLSWSLRPYLVHPACKTVPFVHPIQGSLFDSVLDTFDSARRGIE